MTADTGMSEAAGRQGRLWGTRARDWAELQERTVLPAQKRVLEHLHLEPGTTLLDVGCGSAPVGPLAASLGCRVSGLDASAPLLEIARERVPDGDFRLGDILALPWPDDSFDVVVGFNSFQYAEDAVAALREAHRVVRPGGKIGIVVWGSEEECEAVAHFTALAALMPPRPPDAPGPLAGEQRIAEMAAEAGLTVDTDERVDCPWHYPDLPTALRALKSAGPIARVIDHAGEGAVDEALTDCLKEFRQPDSSYLFRNKFRALTASA
jgi:SAM-dependent methyltransferase